MPTPRKEEMVASVKEEMEQSAGIVIIRFEGLSVPRITELRNKLRETGARMTVIKNRLVKIALAGSEAESLADVLTGPNALVFCGGDVPPAVKALADFDKEHGGIQFKASYLDGSLLDQTQTESLASIPSKPELLAGIAGALNSPISGLVFTLQGIINEFVYTLQAVADKQAGESAA